MPEPTCIPKYYSVLFVVLIIIMCALFALLGTYIYDRSRSCKSGFMNKSASGYYYDTETLRFHSADDRTIGIKVLLKQLSDRGSVYTLDQFRDVPDTFLLSMLDSEDADDFTRHAAKLIVLIDPMYKAALAMVNSSLNNQFTLATGRQIVYDVLVKYFLSLKTPIAAPLNDWSDALLIKTFRTLRMPSKAEFGPVSLLIAPTSAVPAGVATVTPNVPIPVASS